MKDVLKDMANILRRDVIKMTTKAGSGHPTTCMSCAEIMSVLFFDEMRYDTRNPDNPDNDEFVLSKGHAAPILYAALYRAGASKTDLMTLRKWGSPYEGHPVPCSFPWVKVATGSLGQGLSVGVGMAMAAKMQKRNYRTYVLLGDSECAEGSVFEALELAGRNRLGNLSAILDANRLGQSNPTMLQHDMNTYKRRFESFGCEAIIVHGHDIKQIKDALAKAKKVKKRPTVILAKTFKGRGFSKVENKEGWHGKPLPADMMLEALKEIPDPEMPKIKIKKPAKKAFRPKKSSKSLKTSYEMGEMVATRGAYGKALVKLAKLNGLVVATDAEVKNSTHSQDLEKFDKKRFVEAYIAEQNMVGMALGLSVKGMDVFASSFACFLTRAHDQIRMAALSSADLTFCGSHAGISIGADGGSQMGLEDLGMFRCLPGSTVFYPSDGVSAEKLVEQASKLKGITYIRTTRPKTPVIYKNTERFPVGDFKVLRSSRKNKAVIVAAGVTLHEALKAHDRLKQDKIPAAVVDCYSVKPFNKKKFLQLVKKSGNRVVVVEDHYPEGGIGEMIASCISGSKAQLKHLCVRKMPHTGQPAELLRRYGIDAAAITKAVKGLTKR